jgi:uncharacterized protein
MEPIDVAVPGTARSLAATLFVPPGVSPRPGLMFVHGLHSDQVGYRFRARAVTEARDLVCLTFDLSGHGSAVGGGLDTLTPRDHLADLVAAYDALAAHPAVDPARIGVCAASYGAYLSVLLTGHRAVHRLLLRAPGLYPDDLLDVPLGVPRASSAQAGTTSAIRNLSTFGGAVLVVESANDEVIPAAVIAAYLRACPRARHVVLPGAGHVLDQPLRQRFLEEIIAFFGDEA